MISRDDLVRVTRLNPLFSSLCNGVQKIGSWMIKAQMMMSGENNWVKTKVNCSGSRCVIPVFHTIYSASY